MENLSYELLKRQGYRGYLVPQDAPEKVLQIGEGNFLRAFVDCYFDLANEKSGWNGKIVMIQPIKSSPRFSDEFNKQQGLYTVLVRGKLDGKTYNEPRIISSCSRSLYPFRHEDYGELLDFVRSDDLKIVVSNTTEAGIAYDPSCKPDDEPPASFPAKLAQLLHVRWSAHKAPVIILSCELIDHNGAELLKIVKRYCADWGWEDEFISWLENDCTFCTTLVDTIVPGRIRDPKEAEQVTEKLGYEDPFLSVREPFQMWGIQGDDKLAEKLPFIQAEIPGAFVTDDVAPYKKRKVRILNGAHTGFAPGAWLAGFNIVRDCMHDEVVSGFMKSVLHDEIIPILTADLDKDGLEKFASEVEDRFDNPYIDHQLLSICLNSTAKWRVRDLVSLKDYVEQRGRLPTCLTMSLAALIAFYTTGYKRLDDRGLELERADGTGYTAQDDPAVLKFYAEHHADNDGDLVKAVLSNQDFWGEDLTTIAGLQDQVTKDLFFIRANGTEQAFAQCLQK